MRICPYKGCGGEKAWKIRRNKLKCAKCRREWSIQLPLHLTAEQWEQVTKCRLNGFSTDGTAQVLRLHRQQVLRAFGRIREVMAKMEEGRTVAGMVECGWKVFNWGASRKQGISKREIIVFGIWEEDAVLLECLESISLRCLRWGKQIVREKVKIGSEVKVGRELYKELLKDSRMKNEYALSYSLRPVPPNLLNVFEELGKNILKFNVPTSKIPLHIAEFVWRKNHPLNPWEGENKSVDSLIKMLRQK